VAGAGQPLLYGIRPEHLRLDQQGIAANVVLVEPTGSETQVQLRVGARPLTAAFRERITARPGETLCVAPDLAHVHLFDQATGLRL
jgi:multiple sugar transport system ATP-binding protein